MPGGGRSTGQQGGQAFAVGFREQLLASNRNERVGVGEHHHPLGSCTPQRILERGQNPSSLRSRSVHHPTTRVLTVLELLQSRARLSGAELAERLEVDRRTV